MVLVIFLNEKWFQLVKFENMLLFFVLYDRKLDMLGFGTQQVIWWIRIRYCDGLLFFFSFFLLLCVLQNKT